MSIEQELKAKMEAILEHLKKELKTLRTGRANPGIIENVFVEIYGTSMKIKDIANIAVVDFRQILITPFDPKVASAISKGIEKQNLNLQPVLEEHFIRILFPPLDQAVRQEMVKQGKKKTEESKIALREVRRQTNEKVKKSKLDGIITEDQMKKLEKTIQDLTNQFCKQADELCASKEKEILL